VTATSRKLHDAGKKVMLELKFERGERSEGEGREGRRDVADWGQQAQNRLLS
jgi:hypothetical protein